ncbi:hypothetical protein [Streptomyces sp. NPDC002526]
MTQTKPTKSIGADEAYRTLIGHTVACATCRAGDPCVTAVRLGRVWRRVRG